MRNFLEVEGGYDMANLSNGHDSIPRCCCYQFVENIMCMHQKEERAKQAPSQRTPIQELAHCKDFFQVHKLLHTMKFEVDPKKEFLFDENRPWPIELDQNEHVEVLP